jgi:hypothetical protein
MCLQVTNKVCLDVRHNEGDGDLTESVARQRSAVTGSTEVTRLLQERLSTCSVEWPNNVCLTPLIIVPWVGYSSARALADKKFSNLQAPRLVNS